MQTLLVVILGLACGGAFGWALWLRRQLRARRTAPPIDRLAIPPLVHSVASTLDSGLIVLDAERQVRYLNPQAEDLLGLSAESAIGSGLITLLRDYQVDALVGEDAQRRLLPAALAARPQAQVVVIGAEGVSYGTPPRDGGAWKARMLAELGDRLDLSRVHFLGRVAYPDYLSLIRLARVHC